MHNPKLKHRLHRADRPTLRSGALSTAWFRTNMRPPTPASFQVRGSTVAAAAHSPHLEQPEQFVEIVRRFAGRWPEGAP
jgi:pimeloyl-ACP methyl ester carboxylesterase